ncbi:JMJ30 [Symbiodinium natans]|uniref:JMJ30 protein n=1 Tax=Symbiodinium natans TaxID=878477 RepID=A0A812TBK8_9DINO|nr:JMJ30 [Symbiodinium natans]
MAMVKAGDNGFEEGSVVNVTNTADQYAYCVAWDNANQRVQREGWLAQASLQELSSAEYTVAAAWRLPLIEVLRHTTIAEVIQDYASSSALAVQEGDLVQISQQADGWAYGTVLKDTYQKVEGRLEVGRQSGWIPTFVLKPRQSCVSDLCAEEQQQGSRQQKRSDEAVKQLLDLLQNCPPSPDQLLVATFASIYTTFMCSSSAGARRDALGFAEQALAIAIPRGLTEEDPARSHDNKKKELQTLYDLAWARLHTGVEGAAVQPWREVLAIASLLQGQAQVLQKPGEALRLVDLGLILGGPESFAAPELFALAEQLAAELAEDTDAGSRDAKRARAEPPPGNLLSDISSELPHIRCLPEEVPAHQSLGLERFLVEHLGPRRPLIWRGGCADWPATRKWPRVEFWSTGSLGQRWVPVEMDYWLDEGFQLMQLSAFVKHCKEAERRPSPKAGLSAGGYLAQHALFEQLPQLEADILTPDLALCGEGSLLRQVFFGPRGTVTPVHSDPYENIFCQAVVCPEEGGGRGDRSCRNKHCLAPP